MQCGNCGVLTDTGIATTMRHWAIDPWNKAVLCRCSPLFKLCTTAPQAAEMYSWLESKTEINGSSIHKLLGISKWIMYIWSICQQNVHKILHILTHPHSLSFEWIPDEKTRTYSVSEHLCFPYKVKHIQDITPLKDRKMTWGSCAVFMCPPLVTQDNVMWCPLLANRQVVNLFVCFILSRLS